MWSILFLSWFSFLKLIILFKLCCSTKEPMELTVIRKILKISLNMGNWWAKYYHVACIWLHKKRKHNFRLMHGRTRITLCKLFIENRDINFTEHANYQRRFVKCNDLFSFFVEDHPSMIYIPTFYSWIITPFISLFFFILLITHKKLYIHLLHNNYITISDANWKCRVAISILLQNHTYKNIFKQLKYHTIFL